MAAETKINGATSMIALLRNAASTQVHTFLEQASRDAWGPGAPIETHISWVFLTPDRALKLKKPVKLSFLDFSTLEAREQACRRELEVNREFAPELYLGLRPLIADHAGAIHFGPLLTDPRAAAPAPKDGAIVDWIVEMRRFDEGGAFDALADIDAIAPQMMRVLADKISAAHRAAPIPPADKRGADWKSTLAQICAALADAGLGGCAEPWRISAEAELRRVGARLEARRRHGFVRRFHGDLHLGNICLLNGAPTPFDALEFDEDIATIDPLYDLAFAAMDLLWRGRADLCNQLVARYLCATRDYGGLAGWPLFLSLRAAIRAMAAASKGDKALALAKLEFARKLLDPRPPPRLFVIAGLSGSGKSTLAASLAPDLAPLSGAVSISSDATRKRLFGVSPETPLPKEAYRPEWSACAYRRMLKDARRALRAGSSVVLDGVFGRRADRDAARSLASRLGVEFQGIWLETPLEARLTRVEQRAAAPELDASDADAAVAKAQSGALEPDEPGWRGVSAEMTAQETETAARRVLGLAEMAE